MHVNTVYKDLFPLINNVLKFREKYVYNKYKCGSMTKWNIFVKLTKFTRACLCLKHVYLGLNTFTGLNGIKAMFASYSVHIESKMSFMREYAVLHYFVP